MSIQRAIQQGLNVKDTRLEKFDEEKANLFVVFPDPVEKVVAEQGANRIAINRAIEQYAVDGTSGLIGEAFEVACEIAPEKIGKLLAEFTTMADGGRLEVAVF